MLEMKESLMYAQTRAPLVLEPMSEGTDLAASVSGHEQALRARLLEQGAILFRGFDVHSVSDFERFVGAVSDNRLQYTYRSTPRTELTEGVFTATEYPADLEIPLHNENAYQRSWPLTVAFCCLTPPASGGETPIADLRRVQRVIGHEIVDEFATRGVRYVRHYHERADLSWQTVFQTEDRSQLEAFCKQNDIEFEWLEDGVLRTSQVCHGTALHPLTNEQVYFNQAHLFHVSSVGPEVAEALCEIYGRDRLPRHAYFGDGGEIPEAVLERIRNAFDQQAIAFPWKAGDVLLVDNMQFAHGRRSYSGDRLVVASLLDAVAPA